MKETLRGIFLAFLLVQPCPSLASSEKVLTEAGKDVALRCGKDNTQEIQWWKENSLVIKYLGYTKVYGQNLKGKERFSFSSHPTNNLAVKDVKMTDSGTYTCRLENSIHRTVELFVFQVSVFPSTSLLQSEDLVLTSSPTPVPGSVSWMKDGFVMSDGSKLEKKNVQSSSSGVYLCRIEMDGVNRLNITKEITVFGFYDYPRIAYTAGKSAILPWVFNFKVREKPLLSGVHVEEGSISYSSEVLNQLSVTEGVASWPAKSNSKEATKITNDLSIHLLSPKDGNYQMEILLKIGERKKKLARAVYVARLTVSDSKSDISSYSKVPLQCSVNRIDSNWKLCWHHWKTSHEKCGQQGKGSWNIEVTAGNETLVTWVCSVTNGKERLFSANVTLEVTSEVLDLSSSLFWVMIGVASFTLLLIVVFITLAIAWKRRVRRARRRAWLLENLHQQRRCECKGFSPQRLKENI